LMMASENNSLTHENQRKTSALIKDGLQ
jgi:hypothetical protein